MPPKQITSSHPRRRLPVGIYIIITLVFLLAEHELAFTEARHGEFIPAAEEYVRKVETGDMKRRFALSALGVLGFILLLQRRSRPLRINGALAWFVILFLIWAVASLSWAENVPLTVRRLVVLMMLSLGAGGVAASMSGREIVHMVFFCCTFYLLTGVTSEIALGNFLPLKTGYRFAGTFHPNHQGLNCAFVLLSSLILRWTETRHRRLYAAIGVTAVCFLILTKSRTAFTSAMATAGILWMVTSPVKHRITAILSTIIAVPIGVVLFETDFGKTMKHIFFLGRENPSAYTLTGRVPLWQQAIEYFDIRPFLGYGYQGFWTPERVDEVSSFQQWGIVQAHSGYIDMILSVGIIGCSIYLLMLALGVQRSWRFYRSSGSAVDLFAGSVICIGIFASFLESAFVLHSIYNFFSLAVLIFLAFTPIPRKSAAIPVPLSPCHTNPHVNGGTSQHPALRARRGT